MKSRLLTVRSEASEVELAGYESLDFVNNTVLDGLSKAIAQVRRETNTRH